MTEIGTRFRPGRLLCTAGVNGRMCQDVTFRRFAHECLVRHLLGDWGDLTAEDRYANDRALVEGTRLLSAYAEEGFQKIWIITEADRSSTTILFPSEY